MISARPYKVLALALILSVSFMLPQRTQACGPFFTDAIFVYSKHPDFPLEKFAAGKLGVITPNWARSYLVASYRNLAGNPLSENEAKAIKSVWDNRLNLSSDSSSEPSATKWTEARKKVPGIAAAPEINPYRNREKPHEYESFLNCQQDAFDNAEATLNSRIKEFGADSAGVKSWLSAQDTVFSNCSEGQHIPTSEASDLPPLLRADRAYQIAAANFYATNFDQATKQFDSIAQDKSSPWRDKAGYLAARSMLRKGSLADKDEDGRPALAEAETRLDAALNDKSASASHAASARLLNLVRLRLHPVEKLHELAHLLVKKDASSNFKQDVWDYTVLLDKFLGEASEDEAAKKPERPSGLTSDDLTDWVLNFEDSSAAASTHSVDQWEKSKALPWLVAAISKANGQNARAATLLSAAANVAHASPAFPSLAYHSVRLLIEGNRAGEARAMLDKILAADRQNLSPSALNLLLAQRMTLAQSLEEFLQSAQRVPAGFSDDNDGREIPDEESAAAEITKDAKIFFDLDGANAFNRTMPVALIKDAARSKTLAPNLRQSVARAAFVRAAIIDDHDTAIQAASLLQEMHPQLKEFLAAYQSAATPDARRFAATFMSLKFPGLRPYVPAGVGRSTALEEIDSYRDNYWCAEPPTPLSQGDGEEAKAKLKPLRVPEFLKPSQSVAATQLAALQALGTAPNLFCRIAIAWAEKNPADPRAPEALHLAVRSTRYGCTDDQTGRWSKAAYDLLHSRYPSTNWAKATKYWFK